MRRHVLWAAFVLLAMMILRPAPAAEEADVSSGQVSSGKAEDWRFVDNGRIRVGVKLLSGASIAWVSESGSDRNLVNHWDHGRLIQQSYYGAEDGSLWNKRPWRWNPVQGGDWQGSPAKVLEVTADSNRLRSKSIPKHWASGQDIDEALMEQSIELEGDTAHLRFKFAYHGTVSHPKRTQEIPAVFVPADLETLVLYDGEKPWTGDVLSRSKPGWPNESRVMAEHWAAYVDKDDFGLGVYVPIAKRLTCYRFSKPGSPGACAYFAPTTQFAVTPGMTFEYDLYITVGTSKQIRQRFEAIRKTR